jgi:site-specific recombinase XerD
MSALGQKQTFAPQQAMSALHPIATAKADLPQTVKGGKVMDGRLSDKQVARTIKAFAVHLGLDALAFGGHSLRSGFLASAVARGANIFKMADQSGHKSMDTLRGYVRNAEIFQDHAGAGLL